MKRLVNKMKPLKLLFIIFLIFCLKGLLDGSIFDNSSAEKINYTYNNTYIFSFRNNAIYNYCHYEDVQNLTKNYNLNNTASEFSNKNILNKTYEKQKTHYIKDNEYGNNCDYDLYYYDYISVENAVNIGTIDLKANENIHGKDLFEQGYIDEFMKKEHESIDELLVHTLINNQGNNSTLNEKIVKKTSNNYIIKASPIFRMYYFKDKDNIFNHSFSGVYALDIALTN
ncbi:hypothetical protein [Mycoplasma sp. P36-A1]|uniref:hypothetical protein n=1 Tax=Mycoplasma sp. P36-A1 TaxID=3252900 RepID=UPI003C2C3158